MKFRKSALRVLLWGFGRDLDGPIVSIEVPFLFSQFCK